MSLQVWLPLNGNLNNQGLAAIDLNYTPTFVTPGKIGAQCLSSQVGWFSVPAMIGKKQMSFAYWVKINAGTTTNWLDTFSWYSTDGSSNHRSRQEFYSYNTNGNTEGMTTGVWYYNTSNSGLTQRNIGEWYHYAFTIDYNTGITQFFVNGTLWKTTTNANTNHYIKGTDFLLRESTLDCSINDFRLYDHILSKKEVEELSKGLVLHYKLNLSSSLVDLAQKVFTVYNNFSGSGTTGTLTALNEKYMGHTIYRENMIPNDSSINNFRTSLGSHGVYNSRQTFSANTKYVYWIYFRPITNISDIRVGGTASNISGWTEIPPIEIGNGWYRVGQYRNGSVTEDKTDNIFTSFYTPSATSGTAITIDWGPSFLISGTTEIPSVINFDDNSIIDMSGYQNNGIMNNITATSDTPRYDFSDKFSGSTSYVKINDNNIFAQNAEAMTINLWAKNTTWSNGANMKFFSCTESGGFNCETGNSGYIRFPVYVCTNAEQTSYAYKYDSSEVQASALTSNAWNMITWVYDTTGTKTYINGQLHHTYTNTSYGIHFNTNARLYLGCEANGANPSSPYYNGQMSDFRLYYTALTAEQILELYNTSATIDNNGNIYSRELVEI